VDGANVDGANGNVDGANV